MQFIPIDFGTPLLDEALCLRDIVLRKPLGIYFTVEQIEKESIDHHFAVLDPYHRIIGTLLVHDLKAGLGKMRQVAVDPNLQGNGVGSFMVRSLEEWMIVNNYKSITLAARENAVKFYKSLLYDIDGEPFTEVGIPHRTMVKNLT